MLEPDLLPQGTSSKHRSVRFSHRSATSLLSKTGDKHKQGRSLQGAMQTLAEKGIRPSAGCQHLVGASGALAQTPTIKMIGAIP